MMDPFLAELTIGCLLMDVVRLDAGRRNRADVKRLLEDAYGINSRLIAQIAALHDPLTEYESDNPVHIVNYIDRAYLQLPEHPQWSAFRTPFSSKSGGCGSGWYDPRALCFSEQIHYPEQDTKEVPDQVLERLCSTVSAFSRSNSTKEGFVYGMIDVLEDQGTYLSPDGGGHSLFETAKLRAGLACCIYLCLQEQKVVDYPAWFAQRADQDIPCVLVCSLDFLGIKDFKFQQAFSDSLAQITAASFYIDLFRENVLDELMDAAGLSRCNLIFSGGRHLHLFLPNTNFMKHLVAEQMCRVNDWLVQQFQLDLYISYGMHETLGLDRYSCQTGTYYLDIFTKIANQKALIEAHKYSAANLVQMNRSLSRSNTEQAKPKQALIRMIADQFCRSAYISVSSDPEKGIPIGPKQYARPYDTIPLRNKTIRIYTRKDNRETQIPDQGSLIRIWHQEIGAEHFRFQQAAEQPIGLFRMDIDNFRTYMLRQGPDNMDTAAPTKMEISKQLALFLRRDVPRLLKQYQHEQLAAGVRPVLSVIHEGADDIFIFGQLAHLIRFTGMMYRHYQRFTGRNVWFSAGISIYDPQESVNSNAQLAQQLLETAKKIPGKNGVAFRDGTQTYKWEEFFDHGSAI